MQVKVPVNTPARQAKSCMATQKSAMLGFAGAKKVIKEELVSDCQFYWVLDIEEGELPVIIKNAARGEVIIRKFYSTLFKIINRCNALGSKFGKGGQWIKRQLLKRLGKISGEDKGMMAQIEGLSDEELSQFIEVNDKEAIQKLMAGKLIEVEVLNEAIPK